jgi:hypothetical protein
MQKMGEVTRKIFRFMHFVHKSLAINDLRRPGPRKSLIIKDLRTKDLFKFNLTFGLYGRIV